MFKKMRRQDRLLRIDESKRILAVAEYGILSTIAEDDYPFGILVIMSI